MQLVPPKRKQLRADPLSPDELAGLFKRAGFRAPSRQHSAFADQLVGRAPSRKVYNVKGAVLMPGFVIVGEPGRPYVLMADIAGTWFKVSNIVGCDPAIRAIRKDLASSGPSPVQAEIARRRAEHEKQETEKRLLFVAQDKARRREHQREAEENGRREMEAEYAKHMPH